MRNRLLAVLCFVTLLPPLKPFTSAQAQRTRLHILWDNTLHDTSHYGNLVTYLRIKGIVPPSSEGQ